MRKSGLSHDQELYVEVKGQYSGWYSTIILDLSAKDITIAAPAYKGATIPFAKHETLNFYYTNPQGMFKFTSKVLKRGRQPRPFYVIENPRHIYRLQRRYFVRIEIKEKLKYCLRPADEKDIGPNQAMTTGRIVNLSGGGVLFRGSKAIAVDETVWIKLDSFLVIPLKGVVLRSKKANRKEWEMAVRFVDIDQRDQEAIIKKLFEHQRRRGGGLVQP